MLLVDLSPDMASSEGHASSAESGNIRIQLKFGKALSVTETCLLYLEYNFVRVDTLGTLKKWTQFRYRVP